MPKNSKKSKSKARRTPQVRANSKKKKRRKLQKFRAKKYLISGRVVGFTKRGKKGDPLDFQISARMRIPKGYTVAAPVLTDAIRHRLETGRNPKGIQLRIIAWRNPDRADPELAKWRRPSDRRVKDNVIEMLGENRASKLSPQQAAWVTLSGVMAAIELESVTLRTRRG
jgi:hypothetical protein